MSQIVVPTDTPGFNIIRPVPVMGETDGAHCEIVYDNVRVPVTNLLGEAGDGFRIAQQRLGPGRIHHCMRWLGQMQRAFEIMCNYSLTREVYGAPLAEKQTVQNWIADSHVEIQACRLLTLHAAHKIDQGDEARVEISRDQVLRREGAARRHRPRDPGARRARRLRRHAAREHVPQRPRRPHLRRPGRECTAWSSRAASCRASRRATAGTSAWSTPEPRRAKTEESAMEGEVEQLHERLVPFARAMTADPQGGRLERLQDVRPRRLLLLLRRRNRRQAGELLPPPAPARREARRDRRRAPPGRGPERARRDGRASRARRLVRRRPAVVRAALLRHPQARRRRPPRRLAVALRRAASAARWHARR